MAKRNTKVPPKKRSGGWQAVGTLSQPAEQLMGRFSPGLVVAILDHRAKVAKARASETRAEQPRRAARAPRRPAEKARRLALYEAVTLAHPEWKDEAIAFEVAELEGLRPEGAVKRLRRARDLKA